MEPAAALAASSAGDFGTGKRDAGGEAAASESLGALWDLAEAAGDAAGGGGDRTSDMRPLVRDVEAKLGLAI